MKPTGRVRCGRRASFYQALAVGLGLAALSFACAPKKLPKPPLAETGDVTARSSEEAHELGKPRSSEHESGVVERSSPDKPGPSGYVRWCSSGGAPIVGNPVVDDQERTYVATSDGYLHAFERDGRFRWSYTVKGTPLGSVSLRPSDGAILIGTTARLVYAIDQSGTLKWSFRTLTPVWSGLFALNESIVVFLGHDTRLYALTNTGRAQYRVRAPGEPMGGPVVAPSDVVWVGLADGIARFEAAFRLKKFPLPGPVEQIVVTSSGIVARAGGQGFSVNEQGETQALGEARYLASDGKRAVLVDEEDQIRLLEPQGESRVISGWNEHGRHHISAPPVIDRSLVWIPTREGTLVVAPLAGGEGREIFVSEGPLSTPVVGSSRAWALIPKPGGEFCAVELVQK